MSRKLFKSMRDEYSYDYASVTRELARDNGTITYLETDAADPTLEKVCAAAKVLGEDSVLLTIPQLEALVCIAISDSKIQGAKQ